MAIEYTWTINHLSVVQSPEENLVTEAHWLCSGTDGTHTVELDGREKLEQSEGAEFVPYESLTQDIVFGWIKLAMGEAEADNTINSIMACIEGQINSLVNPPQAITKEPVPW